MEKKVMKLVGEQQSEIMKLKKRMIEERAEIIKLEKRIYKAMPWLLPVTEKMKERKKMISKIVQSSNGFHLIVEQGKEQEQLEKVDIYTIPGHKWKIAESVIKQNAIDCGYELQIILASHTPQLAVLFMALEQCTQEQVASIVKRWGELEYTQLRTLYELVQGDDPLSETERTFGGCAGWRAAILWGLARKV
jgi:hypothetical protein